MGHQRIWLAWVAFSGLVGCQHAVIVDSTVPGAEVRVDGVPQGQTPTAFQETIGLDQVYDIEVTAPNHKTQRRLLHQSESAANVAVPLLGVGTCTGCMAPIIGIVVVAAVPADWSVTGIPVAGAAGVGTCLGLMGLGTALVLWAGSNSQRLPDRVLFELEPAEGIALPMAPLPSTDTTPGPAPVSAP